MSLVRAFDLWWKEIENGSRCDQLSLPYVRAKVGLGSSPLPDLRHRHGHRSSDRPTAGSPHVHVPPAKSTIVNPYGGASYAVRKETLLAAQQNQRIDVVVCVHNALDHVRACLDAVQKTLGEHHRLIVVDDGSNLQTQMELKRRADQDVRITLHRNESAMGYTRACNIALKETTGNLVVLLNSDTIVSGDWLLKLADAAFTSPGAGIVGPLSNAGDLQSIPNNANTVDNTAINPLPPGLDVADMDQRCEEWTIGTSLPRVSMINGFCFAIRREVIEAIGLMDELAFPAGYGEETDYCCRASDAGFGLVVATHTYVYHAKSQSYPAAARIALQAQGGKYLSRRYGRERISRALASANENPILRRIRLLSGNLYDELGSRDEKT